MGLTCSWPQQVRVIRWQKAPGWPSCTTVKRSASRSQSYLISSNSWLCPLVSYNTTH